jgi:transcriptional regulator of acetoin/glycerol metabolism
MRSLADLAASLVLTGEIAMRVTEDEPRAKAPEEAAMAGLIAVFSGGSALHLPYPLELTRRVLGREGDCALPSGRVSRLHAEVIYGGGGWRVRDLNSRNGTYLDGQRVTEAPLAGSRVLRLSDTLLVFVADIRPFLLHGIQTGEGRVNGPALTRALEQVRASGSAGEDLLLLGESGSGKELAAHDFHQASPHARGPFVAVNCATIPEGVAERLLFGARRGAYSGATDSEGFFQAAHKGVLFLDEVAELDLGTQAKLLRVLETREVIPLGATAGRQVDVQVCAATRTDLRAAVAERRFREDLYFRIAGATVELPPLRARREEIAWHVEQTVAAHAPGRAVETSFVEQCLLRTWPGNVRELRAAVRSATRSSGPLTELPETVGRAFTTDEPASAAAPPATPARELDEATLRAALEQHGGNVAAAARALGLHRNQMYRLMARFGLKRG